MTLKKFNQGHSMEEKGPPRAPSRVSPSSLGWSPELSHPGMGFNAVPILAAPREVLDSWLGSAAWQRLNFPSGE